MELREPVDLHSSCIALREVDFKKRIKALYNETYNYWPDANQPPSLLYALAYQGVCPTSYGS